MKKFLAIVLALIVVCSLAASAFAVNASPVKPDPLPEVSGTEKKDSKKDEEDLFEVKELATDDLVEKIPGKLLPLDEAEKVLTGDDLAAFKAAYEEAQGYEGVVQHFFWLDLGGYVVAEGDYVEFNFDCEGENVRVFCNGVECEVFGHYTAKLPSGGAIAIVTD